jgi:hypothetical protein
MYHILTKAAQKEQHIIDNDIVKEAYKSTLPLPLKVLPFSLVKAFRGSL